jgi:RNA-directed DNA polymerase
MLKLIRAFLNAGVMENGLVGPTDEGTPQGGPLSPLLSNLVLNQARFLSFCGQASNVV